MTTFDHAFVEFNLTEGRGGGDDSNHDYHGRLQVHTFLGRDRML